MSSSQGLMSGSGRNYGSTSDDTTVGFAGPSVVFDAAQFYRLCDNITSNIYSIAKDADNLDSTLKSIGSKNDSKILRESVHDVQTMANQKITDTTNYLKQLDSLCKLQGAGKPEKIRVTRLTSDFRASVQRYTDVQKKIVAKMKITFLPTKVETNNDDQTQSLVDDDEVQQQAQRLQETLEFEQGLLIEREERIRQIETDIIDVNDIMKQLGTMVQEQGEAITSIEGNIEGTYNEVEAGRQELQKASSYQTKYRKRLFCLLGTGFVILIIVVIILVTQLKS